MVTPLSNCKSKFKSLTGFLGESGGEDAGIIGGKKVYTNIKIRSVTGTVVAVGLTYGFIAFLACGLLLGLGGLLIDYLVILGAYETVVEIVGESACPSLLAANLTVLVILIISLILCKRG